MSPCFHVSVSVYVLKLYLFHTQGGISYIQTYDELLANDFEIVEAGESPKSYSKSGVLRLLHPFHLS